MLAFIIYIQHDPAEACRLTKNLNLLFKRTTCVVLIKLDVILADKNSIKSPCKNRNY